MEILNTVSYFAIRTLLFIITGEFILNATLLVVSYILAILYRSITNKHVHYNNKHHNNIVIITGVSSGIGYQLLVDLLNEGYIVVGTVRKQEDKDRIINDIQQRYNDSNNSIINSLHVTICDVCNNTDIEQLYTTTNNLIKQNNNTRLLAIINNAGISIQLPLECMNQQQIQQTLNVNTIAPVLLTNKLLPLLRCHNNEQQASRIIFISSVAQYISSVDVGLYSASKHALGAIADCYRQELKQFNIDVCTIACGAIKSELREKGMKHTQQVNNNDDNNKTKNMHNNDTTLIANNNNIEFIVQHQYQQSHNKVQQSFENMSTSSQPAAVVSKQVINALTDCKPYTVYYAGKEAKYIPILKLLPNSVIDYLVMMNWK